MIHSECAFFFLLLLLITWTHVRSLSLCVCVSYVCACVHSPYSNIYIYIYVTSKQFSFVVLLWKDSIEFFKSIYFLNFALMIATFVLDALLPRPRKVKHQKQQRVLEPASNDNGKANGVSEKKAQ